MGAVLNKKDPKVASALAFVAGPLGFLYVGWRYAVAATVVFVSVIGVSLFLLPIPSWLMVVNLPVFAFLAYRTSETINGFSAKSQYRSAVASNTLPVAVFAMTSSLPLLGAVNAGVFGITTALSQFTGGNPRGALIMALLITPLFVVVNFVLGAIVAAGIDHGVLRVAPAAPRHIFPPAIKVGAKVRYSVPEGPVGQRQKRSSHLDPRFVELMVEEDPREVQDGTDVGGAAPVDGASGSSA